LRSRDYNSIALLVLDFSLGLIGPAVTVVADSFDLGALSQRTGGNLRELTAEDFERLKAQTSDQFSVTWTGGEDEGDAPVHDMLNRTAEDAPEDVDGGDQS